MTRILCVGRLKEKWQREGCAEYLKRLSRFGGVEICEVDDEPEGGDEATRLRAVEREGKALLQRVKPGEFVAALCVDGEAYSSEQFAAKLDRWQREGRHIALAIGGSNGLSGAFLARADARISFSKLTFPHPLMRVILLEQLYRAAKINAGERYHK